MIVQPSPNFGPRRNGALPSLIVLHYTAMQTAQAAIHTLCNPKTEVSAHYVIDEKGLLTSLVAEEHRAWHAGAGCWGEICDINSHSIGIELANLGNHPFSHPQMETLCALLHSISERYAIPPQNIIAHSDLAPGRKIDPGMRFDWQRLAMENLSIWPSSDIQAPPQAHFRQLMHTIGYSADVSDDTLLYSFRLRFRPQILHRTPNAPVDCEDMQKIAALARDFPIDASVVSA